MALQELGVILEHNRANRKSGSVKAMGAYEDAPDPAVAAVGSARGRGRGRGGSRGSAAGTAVIPELGHFALILALTLAICQGFQTLAEEEAFIPDFKVLAFIHLLSSQFYFVVGWRVGGCRGLFRSFR